jgi:predicted nucleic-acid-binding Zn-ribbon protein
MNTGWICPKCGTPVSPNEKTCPRCTVDGYVTVTVNANGTGISNNNKYCLPQHIHPKIVNTV